MEYCEKDAPKDDHRRSSKRKKACSYSLTFAQRVPREPSSPSFCRLPVPSPTATSRLLSKQILYLVSHWSRMLRPGATNPSLVSSSEEGCRDREDSVEGSR